MKEHPVLVRFRNGNRIILWRESAWMAKALAKALKNEPEVLYTIDSGELGCFMFVETLYPEYENNSITTRP